MVDKSSFKCTHCHQKGHTKERCFELVGYPDWWDHNRDSRKKNPRKMSTATVAETTKDHIASSSTNVGKMLKDFSPVFNNT